MTDKLMKIIIGMALEETISQLEFDVGLNSLYVQLKDLYLNPELSKVESLHRDLVGSSNGKSREIGFRLELLIGFPEPKIDWRDLVIEMQETELNLFNIFYLLEISRDRRHDVNDLREWFNSIGSSVNCIRQGDWIHAKVYASRAFDFSLSNSIKELRKDEHLKGAIDIYCKKTEKYFEQIKSFPVHIEVPEDRLDIIIEVQEVRIELMEKLCLQHPDSILSDVILYPIEKLGVANDYLMNPKRAVEDANYELGCACEHFKEKLGNVKNIEDKKWANSIFERIEYLFTKLPANPWPMKGFGEPGVESRFGN